MVEDLSAQSLCTGLIEIEAIPQARVSLGQVESIVLQCTLQGSAAEDNIDYQWSRQGGSLPSNLEINGGKRSR